VYVLATAVSNHPIASGGLTLLFGLVSLAYGVPFATNFRRCADRWAEDKTWRVFNPRTFIRIHSTAFTVIGTFMVIFGVGRLIAGHP
jgi:hypothetical protein